MQHKEKEQKDAQFLNSLDQLEANFNKIHEDSYLASNVNDSKQSKPQNISKPSLHSQNMSFLHSQ